MADVMVGRVVGANRWRDTLFVPEVVLPAQLIGPAQCDTPEKRLLGAVLERALVDLQLLPGGLESPHRADAVAWFLSDDTEPFTFQYVCDALGLAPDYVRHGLERHRYRLARPPVQPRMRDYVGSGRFSVAARQVWARRRAKAAG